MILRGRRSVHRDDRGDATGCQPGCDSRVSVRTQSNQCFRRAEMRIDEGKIEKDERVVCYVTGNGLKATEAIIGLLPKLTVVKPDPAVVSAMIK